ncbi:MAG: hypothetical protein IPL49_10580 [Saprospirales bacterium]|nr:hypothetical protein [Saprospirales bacterium]MBK8491310.1 hypothetical protein [Saprospirales bacterium]
MGNTNSIQSVNPGEYYSLQTGKQRFQVARVIAVEEEGVHLTLSHRKFPHRPDTLDQSSNQVNPTEGVYLPFRWFPFYAMRPQYLTQEPVNARELVEYKVWQAEGCVYWGD